MRVRNLSTAAALLAVACGGRTGELGDDGAFDPIGDEPYGGGGDYSPSDGGGGGRAPVGGRRGDGGRAGGSAGRAPVGGSYPMGGRGGYAGYPVGGRGGYAGYAGYPMGGRGGYAGYPTGGRGGYAGYPTGGYAGYAGYPTGGYAGGPICDFGYCPAQPLPMPLPACCTSSGTCGVDFSAVASVADIFPTCQDPHARGWADPSCPLPPIPIAVGGCCRPDGTCGMDLSTVGLGCLQTSRSSRQYCNAYGGGGYPGYGGYTGYGGNMGYGGYTGYGGAAGAPSAGGSSGSAQCAAQARSECEVCACGACFDLMAACFRDSGCPEILACANRTGCRGPDCLAVETCGLVITQYGGISGPSVGLALPLFSCLQSAACPCGF